MARLLLLRHAESEWNVRGRWQGWADPPLSPAGERQAADASRLLGPHRFVAAVASDLKRALVTARLATAALGLPGPVAIDAGLREYDVGDWSGLTRPEIEGRWPGVLEAWQSGRLAAPPGGERRDVFTSRIVAAVTRVAATHPTGAVLVITHGGVIGSLERHLGGNPGRIAHLGGRWLDVSGDRLELGDPAPLVDRDVEPAATDRADGDGEGREVSGPGAAAAAANVSPALYLPNREG